MKKIFSLSLTVLFLCTAISKAQDQNTSQDDTPPCLQPEHDQITFLKGEWDVISRQKVNFSNDEWKKSTGTASWSFILDGCAIREEWSGIIDGRSIRWIQILTYNHRDEKWEQLMIDSAHGNLITTEGFYENGKLIFTSPQMRNGKLLIDRTTFEKINADTVQWVTETSLDGGKSWTTFWEMSYVRK